MNTLRFSRALRRAKALVYPTERIFCISFQKTGTTSVGKFFVDFGYPVAPYSVSWKNRWTNSWFTGDYERIFSSLDFKSRVVFEDDPWWCGDFYKVLFHRFPRSRFVHFVRDSDKWFDSLKHHGKGKTLGNTYRHSRIYRREKEYDEKFPGVTYTEDQVDNLLELNESHRDHYKSVYDLRNREVGEFFEAHDPGRLISLRLEDTEKWKSLGEYFGMRVPNGYDVHENKASSR